MHSPCPAPFNLSAHVLAHADARPDKMALSVPGGDDWSYAQLAAAVRGTATGLAGLGLRAGHRVLLRLGNTPDFPILYLACIAADLIPVPTSAQLTGPEITDIARDIAPDLIAAAPGVALPDHPAPVLDLAGLRGFRALPPAPYLMGDPNRPAYILLTSGTSGRPVPVVHAHRAVWARQMMHQGWEGLGPDDRLLHAGAFNWSYTLGTGLMDPWAVGATALIPAEGTPSAALAGLLAGRGATIFAASPGVFRQMLQHPLPNLPDLRHALSAGEKLPQPVRDHWSAATGTAIHEAFGMTECSTFLSGAPGRPAPPGTLGYAQPGRRIALIGKGRQVVKGRIGTIAVHRDDPGLMLGYLDRAEQTAARFAGDWFLTGDLGRMTPDGAIAYEGRADDMMNAGGYRVSPLEVEAALGGHPAVTEAAACAVQVKPDTFVIAAFYVAPHVIEEGALAAFLAARLARYKCPRILVRVPALPRGTNNKLLRRRLRAEWETAHGQT